MRDGSPARLRRQWLRAATVVACTGVAGVAACSAPQDAADGAPEGAGEGRTVERFLHAHGLETPPWDPQTTYLATHEGLIGIGPDGEWRMVSEERHDFMGFSAHPGEQHVLYSSGHPEPGSDLEDPLGFLVSTDGGRTWQVRSLHGEVDFHTMAVGAEGAAIYGWDATGGGLLRSTDEGHEWEELQAPEPAGERGLLALAAHPDDADQVWVGTEFGMMGSADGGESWQRLLDEGPVTALGVDPADPRRMVAYAPPPGRGLLESTDAGEGWSPLGQGPGDDAVTHLAVHPQDSALLHAATHGQSLYRSEDGGQSWQTLATEGVVEQQ